MEWTDGWRAGQDSSLSEDKLLLVKQNPTITQGNLIKMLVYTLLQ